MSRLDTYGISAWAWLNPASVGSWTYEGDIERFQSPEKRQAAVLWLNPGRNPEKAESYAKKLGQARDFALQDRELLAGVLQHREVEPVGVLEALVLQGIREPLALHAGHVQDVRVRQRLLERLGLVETDAERLERGELFLGQSQEAGRDQRDVCVEERQHGDKAVDRAAVAQIAREEIPQVREAGGAVGIAVNDQDLACHR